MHGGFIYCSCIESKTSENTSQQQKYNQNPPGATEDHEVF